MFYNSFSKRFEKEAVEEDNTTLRWHIRPGFCGYSNPGNQSQGYASRKAAESIVRQREAKSPIVSTIKLGRTYRPRVGEFDVAPRKIPKTR